MLDWFSWLLQTPGMVIGFAVCLVLWAVVLKFQSTRIAELKETNIRLLKQRDVRSKKQEQETVRDIVDVIEQELIGRQRKFARENLGEMYNAFTEALQIVRGVRARLDVMHGADRQIPFFVRKPGD